MKKLAVKGNNIKQFVRLTGDPKNREPQTFQIELPYGSVHVTRATDEPGSDFWVHIVVHDEDDGEVVARPDEMCAGTVKSIRVDHRDKHAAETVVKLAEDPQTYHFAVRVGAK